MNYQTLKERIEKIEKEADKFLPNRDYNLKDMTKLEEYLTREVEINTGEAKSNASNRLCDFQDVVKPQIENLKKDSEDLKEDFIKLRSRLNTLKENGATPNYEQTKKYDDLIVIGSVVKAYTSGLSNIATNIMEAYEKRNELVSEINDIIDEIDKINDKISNDYNETLIDQRKELEDKLNNTQYGLITKYNKFTTSINHIISENELHDDKLLTVDNKFKAIYRILNNINNSILDPEPVPTPEPTPDPDPVPTPEPTPDPKKPIKKRCKVKKVLKNIKDWYMKHPVRNSLILGLALSVGIPTVLPGLMMVNSTLWSILGGKGALCATLHSINLGLSKVAGFGAFKFVEASGLYTMGGSAAASALPLYTSVGAKLTTAALALGGIGASVANKINKGKKKDPEKDPKEPEKDPDDKIIDGTKTPKDPSGTPEFTEEQRKWIENKFNEQNAKYTELLDYLDVMTKVMKNKGFTDEEIKEEMEKVAAEESPTVEEPSGPKRGI